MKMLSNRSRYLIAASFAMAVSTHSAFAQAVLYWDGIPGNAPNNGLQPGDGTWVTGGGNGNSSWSDQIDALTNTRKAWSNNDHAIFRAPGTSLIIVSGSVEVNSITFTGTGYTVDGAPLTLTGSSTITATADGTIDAPIGGSAGLTKNGPATLTLGGANTYIGDTEIDAGTLRLSGSLAAGSTVNVNNGGTLGGTGNIGGSLIVNADGTHSPGNSIGIQPIAGNATYNIDSIFDWELNNLAGPGVGTRGTNYDGVDVTGDLLGSGAVFNVIFSGSFNDAFWLTDKSWTNIFTASNSFNLATIFSGGINSSALPSQGSFSFSGNTLNWSAVPEPSSAFAGLLLAAGLLRRRRK